MLCSKCGINESTVSKKVIINGQVFTQHFCNECTKVLEDKKIKQVANIESLLNPVNLFVEQSEKKTQKEPVCDVCGTTLTEFTETGYVGCTHCYDTFYSSVMKMCKNYHGKTSHKKDGGR